MKDRSCRFQICIPLICYRAIETIRLLLQVQFRLPGALQSTSGLGQTQDPPAPARGVPIDAQRLGSQGALVNPAILVLLCTPNGKKR
jgi:hypothetical protein